MHTPGHNNVLYLLLPTWQSGMSPVAPIIFAATQHGSPLAPVQGTSKSGRFYLEMARGMGAT